MIFSIDDGKIRCWDIDTRSIEKTIDSDEDEIYAIVCSPDGRMIVSSVGKKILLWDTDSWELKKNIPVETWINSFAYAPDGETIAGTGFNTVSFYDSKTFELKKSFTGHVGPVNSVSFSSDGKTLASGSRDSTIILWDLSK